MDWLVLIQIVAAVALGAAIGFEREVGAQPAGLRTHMLVSLGAALFTLAVVERAALAELPRARVVSVDYAGADQSIRLSAHAKGGASLPQLAEALRRLPGVAGVELSR